MNIGGWDSAYRSFPDFDNYIFLQDECEILKDDFIEAYEDELGKKNVGLTGESINLKWDKPWSEISNSPLNWAIDISIDGKKLQRVEFYKMAMNKWGINPGVTGRHLRALIWGFNNKAILAINGFPIGAHKEECIASEIAVSKKIEENNMLVTQVAQTPFKYIKHVEWQLDGQMKL